MVQETLAKALNVPQPTISLWLGQKYKGNNTKLDQKLRNWLVNHQLSKLASRDSSNSSGDGGVEQQGVMSPPGVAASVVLPQPTPPTMVAATERKKNSGRGEHKSSKDNDELTPKAGVTASKTAAAGTATSKATAKPTKKPSSDPRVTSDDEWNAVWPALKALGWQH